MTAILNKNKTKIFGLGKWANREQWPIAWLKVEVENFFTLGVYYNNNYARSVEKKLAKLCKCLKFSQTNT